MLDLDGFESERVRFSWKFFLSTFFSETGIIGSVPFGFYCVVDAGAEEGALEGGAIFERTGEYNAIDIVGLDLLPVVLKDAIELDDVFLPWGIFYRGFLSFGGGEAHENIWDLGEIEFVAGEDWFVVVLLLTDGSLELGDIQ